MCLCLRRLCVGLLAVCAADAAHGKVLRPGRAAFTIAATVGPRGARFEPAAGDWSARLYVPLIKCGGRRMALEDGAPREVAPDRVVSVRRTTGGSIDEWYAPGRRGIEQGFTIRAACRNTLAVHVDVEGLTARPRAAGGAQFVDSKGTPRLSYTDLHARDARGRTLPADMTVARSGVVLRVDAAHAVFPVVIDPLVATLQQHLVASDGAAYNGFGASVALDSGTALVGAPAIYTKAGGAYVFVQSGSTWSLQQELAAGDGQPGDAFGSAVAVSGDTALVGADQAQVGAFNYEGAAYVFVRSGNAWTAQQKLVASPPTYDQFGSAVAVSGDTALVGAPLSSLGGAMGQGAVFVFERSGSTWTQTQELFAKNPIAQGRFGGAVALSGTTAVIGALDNHGSYGSADVFVRSGTTWSEQQQLLPNDPVAGWYGCAVAISGDTAFVGAGATTVGGADHAGAVYVFVRSGTTWSEQQKLVAGNADLGDEFGVSLAVVDGVALVGAPHHQVAGSPDHGAAYLFQRAGVTWSGQQLLVAGDGASGDMFGNSVALAGGTTALVGARGDEVGTNPYQGSTYAFGLAQGSACGADSDCPTGQYCAPDHQCSAGRGRGEACDETADCAASGCRLCTSGYCVDGFCCNTSCGGQCEACNVPGSLGTCTATTDAGTCLPGGDGGGGRAGASGAGGASGGGAGGSDASTSDSGHAAPTTESSSGCACRAAGGRTGRDELALFIVLAVAGIAVGRRAGAAG